MILSWTGEALEALGSAVRLIDTSQVDACDRGVADVALDGEGSLEASLAWAARTLAEPRTLVAASAAAPYVWDPAVVRAGVARRISGDIPAVDATPALTRTATRLARGADPVQAETVAVFGALLHSDECPAADIDAYMILGANYPRHTGGLTPLLDRSGPPWLCAAPCSTRPALPACDLRSRPPRKGIRARLRRIHTPRH
ncbi:MULTISPECIES: hypothetical protein [Cryobacterium]|uniref:Uncharacterized protein n=1 Tax=Cryobacterium breve TaxID=1259258 RepID=A0ABY2J362_9MICO|nr:MULTISPECIES: hypothetical protein [Cryobacterium]TFC91772.1 hypothetical protein E3T20_12990 [Cryobacterium sp. TmT3-12]TFC98321.1 hypothetical protein E3O65_08210 [Cryobacterium breve]